MNDERSEEGCEVILPDEELATCQLEGRIEDEEHNDRHNGPFSHLWNDDGEESRERHGDEREDVTVLLDVKEPGGELVPGVLDCFPDFLEKFFHNIIVLLVDIHVLYLYFDVLFPSLDNLLDNVGFVDFVVVESVLLTEYILGRFDGVVIISEFV